MKNQRPESRKLPASYNHGWQKAIANHDFFEIEAIKNLVDRYENPLLSGKPIPETQNISYIKINIPEK